MALLRPAGGGLMWRSSKADVASELGLPPQRERLTPLSLSAIERHFYHRQHQARIFIVFFLETFVSALYCWHDSPDALMHGCSRYLNEKSRSIQSRLRFPLTT